MDQSILVFDFDGTICDSLHIALKVFNDSSEKFGFKKISSDELSNLRQLSLMDLLKRVGVSPVRLPLLLKKAKYEFQAQIEYLKPIPGIKESLSRLKAAGFRMGIVSSNTGENINHFLRNNQIDLFEFIFSGGSLFGKHKVIGKMLKETRIEPKYVVYIGDETRDIEAAKKSGLKTVAVTWGYNSARLLESYCPDAVVSHPDHLLELLCSKRSLTGLKLH